MAGTAFGKNNAGHLIRDLIQLAWGEAAVIVFLCFKVSQVILIHSKGAEAVRYPRQELHQPALPTSSQVMGCPRSTDHSWGSKAVEPRPPCFLLALQVILIQQSLVERELTDFGVRLTWVTILAPTLWNHNHGRTTNPL